MMNLLWRLAALIAVAMFPVAVMAHDPYHGIRQPDNPSATCCGGGETGDCYETKAQFRQGTWFALRRDTADWVAVPSQKIIWGRSPDGKPHLCYNFEKVLCFLPPEGGV